MKATNVKNGKRVAVTHGELVLTPVQTAPKGKATEHDSYVAAHSETGHHHMLTPTKGKLEIVEADGERYAIIKDLTRLWHNKSFDIHEEVVLAPGKYKIGEKTEYNPLTKIVQRVFD